MTTSRDYSAIAGRLLIGGAVCLSLYLASMALAHTALPGCATDSSCQDAMQSRWAFTFGMPVSFIGFVLYSLTLLLSWAFTRRERTLAGLAGGIAVSAILAAAVWFTALQIYAFPSLCVWCCAAHGTAVTGALLLSWSRFRIPVEDPSLVCSKDLHGTRSPLSNDYLFRFTSTGMALTGVGLVALGSLRSPLDRQSAEIQTLTAPAVTSDTGRTHESRGKDGDPGMLPQLLSGGQIPAGAERDPAKVLAFLNSTAPPAPRMEPKASLAVLNSDMNLDAIEAGKPQEIQIKIQNKGNSPLKLGGLILDEGCEVMRMPEGRIFPGEVTAIGVRFTPPATAGAFTRQLHINTEPRGTPELVTLRGRLNARVAPGSSGTAP